MVTGLVPGRNGNLGRSCPGWSEQIFAGSKELDRPVGHIDGMRFLQSPRRPIRCLLVLAAAVCVVVGPIGLGYLAQPVPIEDRVQRIRPGMTLGEVEAVLD